MPAIGITGGIASGKSTWSRLLAGLLKAPLFEADASVRSLLETDDGVAREVRLVFGPGVFSSSGVIDRAELRRRVFSAPAQLRQLEAILHPRVRAHWQGWLHEQLQKAPGAVLLVEIPLLYETDAASFFARTVVVGCSRPVQLRRLTQKRGLSADIASQIIANQWDFPEKLRRCDHLIWNDGALDFLQVQAELFARFLEVLG